MMISIALVIIGLTTERARSMVKSRKAIRCGRGACPDPSDVAWQIFETGLVVALDRLTSKSYLILRRDCLLNL